MEALDQALNLDNAHVCGPRWLLTWPLTWPTSAYFRGPRVRVPTDILCWIHCACLRDLADPDLLLSRQPQQKSEHTIRPWEEQREITSNTSSDLEYTPKKIYRRPCLAMWSSWRRWPGSSVAGPRHQRRKKSSKVANHWPNYWRGQGLWDPKIFQKSHKRDLG